MNPEIRGVVTTGLCKLTNEKGQSLGGVQWGPGVTHYKVPLDPTDPRLNSPVARGAGFLYAFPNVDLALLAYPLVYSIKNPLLWEAEGLVLHHRWVEIECSTLTTIRETPFPDWYLSRRWQVLQRFARLCAEVAEAAGAASATAAGAAQDAVLLAICIEHSPNIASAAAAAAIAAFDTYWAAGTAGITIDFMALARLAIDGAGSIAA